MNGTQDRAGGARVRHFGVFLSVGGAAALLYFSLLIVLLEAVRLEYLVGVSLAYIAAITFHFLLNRHLTFKAANGGLFRQGCRYAVMAAANCLLTLAIVFCVVEQLRFNAYIGAVAAIAVSVVFSYVVSKVWVFWRR